MDRLQSLSESVERMSKDFQGNTALERKLLGHSIATDTLLSLIILSMGTQQRKVIKKLIRNELSTWDDAESNLTPDTVKTAASDFLQGCNSTLKSMLEFVSDPMKHGKPIVPNEKKDQK